MDARRSQRCEYPDQIVSDEEVRPGRPTLRISIEVFQVSHPFFTGMGVPLRESWSRGVMHHDELWPPVAETQRSHVFIEVLRGKTPSYNTFPCWHHLLPPR